MLSLILFVLKIKIKQPFVSIDRYATPDKLLTRLWFPLRSAVKRDSLKSQTHIRKASSSPRERAVIRKRVVALRSLILWVTLHFLSHFTKSDCRVKPNRVFFTRTQRLCQPVLKPHDQHCITSKAVHNSFLYTLKRVTKHDFLEGLCKGFSNTLGLALVCPLPWHYAKHCGMRTLTNPQCAVRFTRSLLISERWNPTGSFHKLKLARKVHAHNAISWKLKQGTMMIFQSAKHASSSGASTT